MDDLDDDIYLYSLKGVINLIPYLIPKSTESSSLEEKEEILRNLKNPESPKETRTILNSILRNPTKSLPKKVDELLLPSLSAVENIIIPHVLKICTTDDEKLSQRWTIIEDLIWLWKKLLIDLSKVSYYFFDKRKMIFQMCLNQFLSAFK